MTKETEILDPTQRPWPSKHGCITTEETLLYPYPQCVRKRVKERERERQREKGGSICITKRKDKPGDEATTTPQDWLINYFANFVEALTAM